MTIRSPLASMRPAKKNTKPKNASTDVTKVTILITGESYDEKTDARNTTIETRGIASTIMVRSHMFIQAMIRESLNYTSAATGKSTNTAQ